MKIDKKREPVFEDFSDVVKQPEEVSKFEAILLLWTILRKLSFSDQIIPSFSGYTVQEQSISINAADLKKTNLTYLPPINSPITHYDTIYELFKTLQTRATITKMRYVNLTLDAGAYVNAYRVLCNYPKVFSNLILHLGDFHYMKELFGIVGTLVKASGFEDIIFQAGVCSTGSLNGVLAGSHYNRCWTVHTAMAEALERLLLELFLSTGHHIPTVLQCFYGKNDDNSKSSCIDLIYHEDVINFQQSYVKFQQNIRDGLHGKTAQFWMVNYIDIIRFLHQIHYSVQTNNYDLRLDGLKKVLPFCFALNKQNYARYGSIYVNTLTSLDITHPGCKELLIHQGLSVQGQSRYPTRTPIDQRGEQTINRDAKTSGGIKFFASDQDSVLKWTLNRPFQAQNTEALYKMSDVNHANDEYKATRPSQILKSEKYVTDLVEVLRNDFVNPFDSNIDKDKLLNLSSGIPVNDDLAEDILKIKDRGIDSYNEFVEKRIKSQAIKVHDPIKRQKCALFKDTERKVTLKHKGNEKTIEANRDVLSKLLAHSAKHNKVIDFEVALTYPLSTPEFVSS